MQTLQHISKHIVYLTRVEVTDRPILTAVSGTRRIDEGQSEWGHAGSYPLTLGPCIWTGKRGHSGDM